MFDVIGKRNWFFAFSLLITIPGLIFLLLGPVTGGKVGLQFAIDFTGGTVWTIRFEDRDRHPGAGPDGRRGPGLRRLGHEDRRRVHRDPDQGGGARRAAHTRAVSTAVASSPAHPRPPGARPRSSGRIRFAPRAAALRSAARRASRQRPAASAPRAGLGIGRAVRLAVARRARHGAGHRDPADLRQAGRGAPRAREGAGPDRRAAVADRPSAPWSRATSSCRP